MNEIFEALGAVAGVAMMLFMFAPEEVIEKLGDIVVGFFDNRR